MALQFVITNAGRAAMLDPANGGSRAVRVVSAGVSATAVAADPAATTLPGEVKRIATIAGDAVATDILHLIVRDESDAAYTVRSIALYLDDGTLFGLYGQAAVILEKSAAAVLLLAIDLTLANLPAAQITFGATNFLNPPATTERAGVVELATEAEAAALVDAVRALTPKGLAAVFTAANVLSRLVQVDGAGSGLDADLLDGLDSAAFLRRLTGLRPIDYDPTLGNMTIRGDAGGWATGYHFLGVNGGALGSFGALGAGDVLGYLYMGLSATVTNALRIYADRPAWGTNTIMHLGNDGAGSGFDADLLDGLDATAFLRRLTGTRPIDYDPALGNMTIRGDAGGWATGYHFLGVNGGALGSFGARGAGDVLDYLYMGLSATATNALRIYGDRPAWGTSTIMHLGNDGAGSGFDADLLDGQEGAWYADVGARLGYTPLDAATYTAANILAKLLGVDGAGSGLDADLLDGLDATAFLRRGIGVRPLEYDPALGNMTIRGDAGGWATGYHFLGVNGGALGSFGALGAGDALTYLYMGLSATATNALRIYGDRPAWGTNTIMHFGNDGAGSGFDADLLDGQEGAWYADVRARLGYTPLDRAGGSISGSLGIGAVPEKPLHVQAGDQGQARIRLRNTGGQTFDIVAGVDSESQDGLSIYDATAGATRLTLGKTGTWNVRGGLTRGGQPIWGAENDGAGSGLDADLLDGRDAGEFVLKTAFDAASRTPNGYQVLPGGLVLQWCAGAASAAGSEALQTITLPVTFPTACLRAFVSTRIDQASGAADAFYQLVGDPAANAVTVQRQVPAGASDTRPTTPLVFAVGY